MIAAYLFSGGLSAGSAMLGAGADLTGRPGLRKVARLGALASILASLYFLIADLGRPERFHHMLRVAKPSSPMSMGTWILGGYGPGVGLAAVAELLPRRIRRSGPGRLLVLGGAARRAGGGRRRAGGGVLHRGAVVADGGSGVAGGAPVPAVRVHRFGRGQRCRAGHAAGARGRERTRAPDGGGRCGAGAGRGTHDAAPPGPGRARPIRRAARTGCGRLSELLTVGGAVGAAVSGRRRWAVAASGAALLAGSALQRFGIFEAGVASTKDPQIRGGAAARTARRPAARRTLAGSRPPNVGISPSWIGSVRSSAQVRPG